MHINDLYNDNFIRGIKDYFYLINKNFPEKGSLKLVGDRYKLSGEQRTVLYRGISSEKFSELRKNKLTEKPVSPIIVDGYNVLFTILNYRLGRFVFISNDNICRDAGSLFGKIRNEKLFKECTLLLTQFLSSTMKEYEIIIYLDIPVSSSRKHIYIIEKEINSFNLKAKVIAIKSADNAIRKHTVGTIATSDTAIIDSTSNPIFDIPRTIIESYFDNKLANLKEFL
ncbi:MAG: DUF434 domain-containing protein [Bacteroidales bacterium]|nr:DUF434 domain-containing protein [Bacteroidales bacterium]